MTTSSLLLKSCGNQLPGIVNSTGSSIMIEFTSDFIITRKGFKLKFETVYGKLVIVTVCLHCKL